MTAEAEQQLFCAVILQAIEDATTPLGHDVKRNREIERARDWFTRYNRNFVFVCSLADFEPGRVRAKMIKRLADLSINAEPVPAQKNILYTYDDQARTLVEWSELTGIAYGTMLSRIKRGCSIEQAITTPVKGSRSSKPISIANEEGQANADC